MHTRRSAIFLTAGAVFSVLTSLTPAVADPASQQMLAYLVDLPGWQAGAPGDTSENLAGAAMSAATRLYKRGGAEVQITVASGPAVAAAMGPLKAGVNINSGDTHIASMTIAGFKASKSYIGALKSGAFLIALGDDALFTLRYKGIAEDEAQTLVQKIDIKGLAAAAKAK